MRVLISGASIAGPVLAYWLNRYGFDVTVVERAPALRKSGGHAVDLFRPAMQIAGEMGLLDAIRAKATGTDAIVIHRDNAKPVTLDLRKVYSTVSDEHVEIMRDDPVKYPLRRNRSQCRVRLRRLRHLGQRRRPRHLRERRAA